MPSYTCVRRCFWRGQLWEPGQSVVVSADEAGRPENAMVRGDCWRVEKPVAQPPAPVAPAAEPPVVSAPDAGGAEPPPEGDGTNLRAAMLDLCLKNGIEVSNRAGLDLLRKRLAEHGIVVN